MSSSTLDFSSFVSLVFVDVFPPRWNLCLQVYCILELCLKPRWFGLFGQERLCVQFSIEEGSLWRFAYMFSSKGKQHLLRIIEQNYSATGKKRENHYFLG